MNLKRILVVDDELEALDQLDKKLMNAGFQVAGATNGKEAIDRAKTFYPDIILMDIMLPDIDGAEVVTILQRDPSVAHIPIIFLSGIAPKNDVGQGYSTIVAGGHHFPAIPKPFIFDQLLALIKRILY